MPFIGHFLCGGSRLTFFETSINNISFIACFTLHKIFIKRHYSAIILHNNDNTTMKTIIYYLRRLVIAIILYFIFCNVIIYLYSLKEPQAGADTMVILGAQVIGDPARPNITLQERLDTALIYLQQNPDTVVIVCGGQGKDESATEASVMKNYLIEHGIKATQIYEEDQSTRTAQQFRYANNLYPLGKTVVVTNEFHMLRSIMLAKRSGFHDVSALSANTHFDNKDKYNGVWREPLALINSYLFDHQR